MALSGRSGYKALLHVLSEMCFSDLNFEDKFFDKDEIYKDKNLGKLLRATQNDKDINLQTFRVLWLEYQSNPLVSDLRTRFLDSTYQSCFENLKDLTIGDLKKKFLDSNYQSLFKNLKDSTPLISIIPEKRLRLFSVYGKFYRLAASLDFLGELESKNVSLHELLIEHKNKRLNLRNFQFDDAAHELLEELPSTPEKFQSAFDTGFANLELDFRAMSPAALKSNLLQGLADNIENQSVVISKFEDRYKELQLEISSTGNPEEFAAKKQKLLGFVVDAFNRFTQEYLDLKKDSKKKSIEILLNTLQKNDSAALNNYYYLLNLIGNLKVFYRNEQSRMTEDAEQNIKLINARIPPFPEIETQAMTIIRGMATQDQTKLQKNTLLALLSNQTLLANLFPSNKWKAFGSFAETHLFNAWFNAKQPDKSQVLLQIERILSDRVQIIQEKNKIIAEKQTECEDLHTKVDKLLSQLNLEEIRLKKYFVEYQEILANKLEGDFREVKNKTKVDYYAIRKKYKTLIGILAPLRAKDKLPSPIETPKFHPTKKLATAIKIIQNKPFLTSRKNIPQPLAKPVNLKRTKQGRNISIGFGIASAATCALLSIIIPPTGIILGAGFLLLGAFSFANAYRLNKKLKTAPSLPTAVRIQPVDEEKYADSPSPKLSSPIRSLLNKANLDQSDATLESSGNVHFEFGGNKLIFTRSGNISLWRASGNSSKQISEQELPEIVRNLKQA